MNRILIFIGSVVVSMLVFAVPILAAISYCLGWNHAIKAVLSFITAGELLCLITIIDTEAANNL